ncbi:putative transcription factor B3-Domain family [Helianthus annuus]|nr:putative transcription factor B3-Domain family [Helianthus annuus]KAJ0698968.1 putative transcription factor B3-Domain family [Helianthus annuus]
MHQVQQAPLSIQEMNDQSIFCTDQFPQLFDLPCMSASSSSSSNPAPAATTSTASSMSSATSSAASWAVLQSEGDGPNHGDIIRVSRKNSEEVPVRCTAASGGGSMDCMDVMENYGYMDLIDSNEMWDPSSIFEQNPPDLQPESEVVEEGEMKKGGGDGGGRLDELGAMFFEWLKSNKELISAEDMKKIKLKKSTVECASKRLGSSQEGKKQLLKLILEWVQQHQLQRKNNGIVELHTAANTNPATLYPSQHLHGLPPPSANPPPTFSNGLISHPPWILPYPPYMVDQTGNGMAMVASPVQPPSSYSYMGGDYDSSLDCQMNPYNNTGSGDYQVLESAPSWNPSQITMAVSPYTNQFPDVGNNFAPQFMPLAPGYPDQFSYNMAVNYAAGGGDEQRLMRLGSSATKEARKKRMARQRRTYFHHHHSRQSQNNQHNRVADSDQHPQAMLVDDNCSGKSHVGNGLYWPSTATLPPPPPQMEVPRRTSSRPHQSSDRLSKQTSPDKLQGFNTDKNLKFLLQKVLKQSDVGSLGRIVMPKKEAESHLPDLNSRDGITIPMEDIGTSQVWNMRYRFWPNNKSRMYLLENTGDFVKANGLQEGDFIVLYSNVKCGKYLIRGVKVRQPASGKSEGKKPVKRSYHSTT